MAPYGGFILIIVDTHVAAIIYNIDKVAWCVYPVLGTGVFASYIIMSPTTYRVTLTRDANTKVPDISQTIEIVKVVFIGALANALYWLLYVTSETSVVHNDTPM